MPKTAEQLAIENKQEVTIVLVTGGDIDGKILYRDEKFTVLERIHTVVDNLGNRVKGPYHGYIYDIQRHAEACLLVKPFGKKRNK